jgi:hypothetical protein
MRAMADMQRWAITALFAAVGLFAAVSKIWRGAIYSLDAISPTTICSRWQCKTVVGLSLWIKAYRWQPYSTRKQNTWWCSSR